MTPPEIHDRGRGPEIKGTRITVYDVLDYHKHGWAPGSIAVILTVSTDQVKAAIRYIEDYHDEVWRDYEQILARHAKGNPPEVLALMAGSRQRLEEARARLRAQRQERNDAGHPRGP